LKWLKLINNYFRCTLSVRGVMLTQSRWSQSLASSSH
jgi:hypothetical protein